MKNVLKMSTFYWRNGSDWTVENGGILAGWMVEYMNFCQNDWMVEHGGKLTEWWNTDWMVESPECCSLNWFRLWCMLHPYNNSTKKLLCLVPAVVLSEPLYYTLCRFGWMLIV